MEFLRLIFSSFWAWVGFVLLVGVVLNGTAEIVKACKRNRKVRLYKESGGWAIEIENATSGDAINATLIQKRIAESSGKEDNRATDG